MCETVFVICLLQNCADAILQRGEICAVIVMLLLATAFNYGAYFDESPVRVPKISSNHLVAAYFLYAYRCGFEAVFIFGVPAKPIRICGERRSIRSDCCIITRDNVKSRSVLRRSPVRAPKKNRYHLVSVLFYCVKQYSLSVYCKIALMQFYTEKKYIQKIVHLKFDYLSQLLT